jgi:hypothetical protein
MTIEQIRRVRRQGDRVTITLTDGSKRNLTTAEFNTGGYKSPVSYGFNDGRYDTKAVSE